MTKIWENADLRSSLAIVVDLVFDMHLTCNTCQYLDMYCIIPQASESIPEQVMGEKQIRLQGLFFLLFFPVEFSPQKCSLPLLLYFKAVAG